MPLPIAGVSAALPASRRASLSGFPVQGERRTLSRVSRGSDPGPLVVRGREEILQLKPMLVELAEWTGQSGAADDLAYFLSMPQALKKTPHLILQRAAAEQASVQGFCGATLLFEYRMALGGLRVFASEDSTGRRTVLARGARARVAAEAVRTMMRRGAQVVHLAFEQRADEAGCGLAIAAGLSGMRLVSERQVEEEHGLRGGRLWAMAERAIRLYLPLESTFDATLARIGQRTRSNLRYYRRRAERELGCGFVAEAKLGLEEFLALNRECMFAVPEAEARWRWESLRMLNRPLLCGIQDGQGRWLALVGGRRRTGEVEIDWQMNRNGLAQHSLCTVVRSYLIEHEVGRGSKRMYIEGGTPHPIGRSFVEGGVVELTAIRRSAYTGLLKRFASRVFPEKNYVSQVLRDGQLEWHDW